MGLVYGEVAQLNDKGLEDNRVSRKSVTITAAFLCNGSEIGTENNRYARTSIGYMRHTVCICDLRRYALRMKLVGREETSLIVSASTGQNGVGAVMRGGQI